MVEFRNRDDVSSWCAARPLEVATALVARTALRVAPLMVAEVEKEEATALRDLVLPVMRALYLADFAGAWPERTLRNEDLMTHAMAAARAATSAARGASPKQALVAQAAALACDMICGIAAGAADFEQGQSEFDHEASARALDAFDSVAKCAGNAVAAARSAAGLIAGSTTAASMYRAFGHDAEAVMQSRHDGRDWLAAAASVSRTPLWPSLPPMEISSAWQKLEHHLGSRAHDENWSFWTDWYNDLLAGNPRHDEGHPDA